jgi:hypothetical protein
MSGTHCQQITNQTVLGDFATEKVFFQDSRCSDRHWNQLLLEYEYSYLASPVKQLSAIPTQSLTLSTLRNKSLQRIVTDRLCGLVVTVPVYRTEMYCVSCEERTEFIYIM